MIVAAILAALVTIGCQSIRREPKEPRPYMIRLANGGAWVIAITAKNNEELYRSPPDMNGQRLLEFYAAARNAAGKAHVPQVVEQDQEGRWHWLLRTPSGFVAAVGSDAFDDRASALANYEDFRAALMAWDAESIQYINHMTL